MSEEYHINSREQEEGSIGIGAMIVFIALILVAAVASTIIIKTAEELQQNAESTSDDTRKEISGKISIIQMLVNGSDGTDMDSMILTAKVASGSTDVLVNNIDFMVTCGDASTFGIVTGNLGTDSPWGQPITETFAATPKTWTSVNAETLAGTQYTPTTELTAGTVFKFDINFDIDYLGNADAGPCKSLAGVGETLQLKMIVDGGGTTISELSIDSVVSGKAVV